MKKKLNRKLLCDERVIHIDGDSRNNNIDNLKVVSKKEFYSHIGKIRYEKSDKKSKTHPNLILDYFKNIDTPEKAYWLGFIAADGYINEEMYKLSIMISQKDKIILERFLECIHGNIEKIMYTSSKENRSQLVYICITNKIFVKNIIDLNIRQNKSFNVRVPEYILLSDGEDIKMAFVLGYFDGNGYLDSRYNNGGICSASLQMLTDIQNILNTDKQIKKNNKNVYHIYLRSIDLKNMYNSYEYSLDRKKILDRILRREKKIEEIKNRPEKKKDTRNSQYGTFWITNGEINKKWRDSFGDIPSNFYRGRKI